MKHNFKTGNAKSVPVLQNCQATVIFRLTQKGTLIHLRQSNQGRYCLSITEVNWLLVLVLFLWKRENRGIQSVKSVTYLTLWLCGKPAESLWRNFNCETGGRYSAENGFYCVANYMLLWKYEEVQVTNHPVLEGWTKIQTAAGKQKSSSGHFVCKMILRNFKTVFLSISRTSS